MFVNPYANQNAHHANQSVPYASQNAFGPASRPEGGGDPWAVVHTELPSAVDDGVTSLCPGGRSRPQTAEGLVEMMEPLAPGLPTAVQQADEAFVVPMRIDLFTTTFYKPVSRTCPVPTQDLDLVMDRLKAAVEAAAPPKWKRKGSVLLFVVGLILLLTFLLTHAQGSSSSVWAEPAVDARRPLRDLRWLSRVGTWHDRNYLFGIINKVKRKVGNPETPP